ncbi:hypothetical protein [Sediminitomix flava]|uniref:Uncharacterized protein n=1 Tax=Sediminitomix flava TaxID=379075 RepID=A0A315ZYV0_SEDFL|nr:hypothetical protein [Sediminitomix flava]PWJ42547.1 hypothetical protein BC781_10290 [Sediminitomix flava]
MQKRFQIVSLLFCISLFACDLDDDDNEIELFGPSEEGSTLIFGHFFGFCIGESCIEIFKLQNGLLFEDSLDLYPNSSSPYDGEYTVLSNEKYQIANDLFLSFPTELLDETDTIIGAPDAADGGGIYIEVIQGGKRRYWLIDQMKNNIPEYLHPFIDDVNNTIQQLQ